MRHTVLVLMIALLSMGISIHGWSMADEDLDQDILEMKKQLLAMETRNGRSLDVYELRFQPQTLKHITIVDRLGEGHVFYYLPYRLRNPGSEGNAKIEEEYPRYNEILKNIADEFEDIVIDGGKLVVDTDTENDAAAVVLKRKELEAGDRTVRLSIMAHDENGSRIRILDAVPGKGPQEKFNFEDEGQRSINIGVNRVRERIEEKEGRRLLLTSEISQRKLPIYSPGNYDEDNNVIGEVYGVIIFDDLAVNGDAFEIQVRGLSNKTRKYTPEHDADKIADFWNMRVYRRTYYINYKRSGDEYFRGRDAFTLTDKGWRWRNTFQRVHQRSTMAHVNYFLDNVATDKGDENKDVVEKALAYYQSVREQRQELVDEQENLARFEQDLPDIKEELQSGE